MKIPKFTETVLRDGQQSLIATRMKTKEMLPILEVMDNVGYYSIEMWGGATFDSCLRYLNENPWQRLKEIRKRIKKTKLQMLLRGQNLLGYKHYPNYIVERFIKKSIDNGIDIIRIFDALNDIENLRTSITTIKNYGGHCQCAISYTVSKIHTEEYYLKLSRQLENLGADSICIKDMAGILQPNIIYELINKMKQNIKIPIEIHSHCTSGMASMTYLKAIEAGVDIIDTAISPFAGGTSQPPTETFAYLFSNENNLNLNLKELNKITHYFNSLRDKYINEKVFNNTVMKIEPNILTYQVPGGMLSNLLYQLKVQKAEDRYEEILKEIPKVREELGYPPLVTPISQMVGAQALFNVICGKRYQIIPKEIKEYVKGYYGKTPAPINQSLINLVNNEKSIHPPQSLNVQYYKEYNKAREELNDLYKNEEDILSYIIFPEITKKFLENRSIEEEFNTLTPI